MLKTFRKLMGNTVARLFSGAMLIAFVFWGISNVSTLVSSSTTVAHYGGTPIDLATVQAEYQRQLNQSGAAPDAAGRQQIAQAALATVLRQQAFAAEEQSLGIAAPDAVVAKRVYAVPGFQTNGVFDQAKFNAVLQQNSLSPARFLGLVRDDLGNSQLLQPLVAGAAPPQPLVDQIFAYVAQARTAETVTIPAAAQTPPPAPALDVLRRYWKNHPAPFTAPEYRSIQLVVLSAALIAPTEPVSDSEIAALYAQTAAQQSVPASRSVQIITVSDPAKAAALAEAWGAGADWTAMQARAAAAGAAAVELDHALADQFPSQTLASAVFAAPPGTVTGPVQGPLGIFVFKVTDAVAAGAPTLASVATQIKQQIQMQKAQADLNTDVDNVQDALAGQTPLDKLPGNLGLTAVEGTLDGNGNALDGTPAPIPGSAAFRAAVVKAVFAAHKGDPAQLNNGPDNSYYAFTIDDIQPPAMQPFDMIQGKVLAAWRQDQLTREAEAKAAATYAAVNAGQKIDDVAAAAGLATSMSAPVTRAAPPSGLPAGMVPILFSLKLGEATMQQTSTGFIVAVLTKIDQPTAANDPQDVASIRQAMAKSLQNDVAESFLAGLQTRNKISVDQKLLAQVYQ